MRYQVEKKRHDSFDLVRETTVRPTTNLTEVHPDSDESIKDMEANIEKYKRHSSSLLSADHHVVPIQEYQEHIKNGGSDDSSDESEEKENPFLMNKQQYRQPGRKPDPKQDNSDSDGSDYGGANGGVDVEEESDDESIFDRLRDEVQHAMYKGEGPHAIVNRYRDSRVEVDSN